MKLLKNYRERRVFTSKLDRPPYPKDVEITPEVDDDDVKTTSLAPIKSSRKKMIFQNTMPAVMNKRTNEEMKG